MSNGERLNTLIKSRLTFSLTSCVLVKLAINKKETLMPKHEPFCFSQIMILISNNGKIIAGCVVWYWRYVVVIVKDYKSIYAIQDVRYDTQRGKIQLM